MLPRVLVVDDEKHILQLLVLALEDDFEVHTASTGLDALAQAERHSPDLVLLDVMLPGLSGLDVAKRLREQSNHKDTPLVFLTAMADLAGECETALSGACAIITKPFDLDDLRERLIDLVQPGH